MNTIYHVTRRIIHSGQWQPWTHYATYDEAEFAACGLVSNGNAIECHVWELGDGEPKLIASVKPGWPDGADVVKGDSGINIKSIRREACARISAGQVVQRGGDNK
jgi:hypothetical protein